MSKDAKTGLDQAVEARKQLGVDESSPIDDLWRVLERSVDELEVFVRPLGEGGILGAYLPEDGHHFIIVNSDCADVRLRFTLAHEYGHYFMRHGTRVDRTLDWSDTDPRETQANYFAGSLLLPQTAIAKAFTDPSMVDFAGMVELAAQYGVSADAARIRLSTHGYLKPKKNQDFRASIENGEHYGLATRMADSLSQAKSQGGRMPNAMEARVLHAVDAGILTEKAASTILRTPHLNRVRERHAVASD